jgi:PAS domain S-box-containing protein
MRRLLQSGPIQIATTYAVFGVLWIVLSDGALGALVGNKSDSYASLQTFKGWAFVLLSAILILALATQYRQFVLATQREVAAQARLISDVTDALIATDLDLSVVTWNHGAELMFGWTSQEAVGRSAFELIRFELEDGLRLDDVKETLSRTGQWTGEVRTQKRSGEWFPAAFALSATHDDRGRQVGYVAIVRDVSLIRNHEEELLRRNRALLTIRACNRALVRAEDEKELLDEICRIVVIHGGHKMAWVALPDGEDWSKVRPAAVYGADKGYLEEASRAIAPISFGDTPLGQAVETGRTVQTPSYRTAEPLAALSSAAQNRGLASSVALPLRTPEGIVGVLMCYSDTEGEQDGQKIDLMEELADDLAFGLVTIRARRIKERAEADLAAQEALLRETEEVSKVGGWQFDVATGVVTQTDQVYRIYGMNRWDSDPSDLGAAFSRFVAEDKVRLEEAFLRAVATGEPYDLELRFMNTAGEKLWVRTKARAEMKDGRVVRVYGNIMDITERKNSEAKIRQQFERITASREIDSVITATFEERLSLNVLLLHAVTLLEVDAARVLVAGHGDPLLRCSAAAGFKHRDSESTALRLGEGYTAKAMAEGKPVPIWEPSAEPILEGLMHKEGFSMLYGAPLHIKGRFIGMLEVFLIKPGRRDSAWLDFLGSLANQAAIAIDNATLFRDLQRSNQSLTLAYDATIEGWSRALDMRDRETEGHSRRVTEKTLELAKAMEVPHDQLIHIRRGALLHDIGKMGIPDAILLKLGKLTEEEWHLMKTHPQLAYDMLCPIQHLGPALDIPLSHHEKWDGSGYPRGLKGEEIPLAARIFAVVDVWDALMSDRPYRTGWPRDQVLEYIRSQSGTHFDPTVVDLFLKMEGER